MIPARRASVLVGAVIAAATTAVLTGCGLGAPVPTRSATPSHSSSPSPTPSATPAALTLPDGAVLVGEVRLQNPQGAVRATVVAYPPTSGTTDTDAVAKVVEACPGEYDASALSGQTIMRVDYTTVALRGSADAIIVAPRPSVVNSDSIGIASTGNLVNHSAGDVPHCRREVTITGATTGTAYVVLPEGTDWHTLPFGFFPLDDGVSEYDVAGCRFAFSSAAAEELTVSTLGGCVTAPRS